MFTYITKTKIEQVSATNMSCCRYLRGGVQEFLENCKQIKKIVGNNVCIVCAHYVNVSSNFSLVCSGSINNNETFDHAIRRELNEEYGITYIPECVGKLIDIKKCQPTNQLTIDVPKTEQKLELDKVINTNENQQTNEIGMNIVHKKSKYYKQKVYGIIFGSEIDCINILTTSCQNSIGNDNIVGYYLIPIEILENFVYKNNNRFINTGGGSIPFNIN